MDAIIVQFIGLFGLLGIVLSFQKNNKSFTLLSQMVGCLFFTVHFFLLGAFTGAAMNFLGAARAFSFNLAEKRKEFANENVKHLFILLFFAAGLLSWQGPLSLLPPISMSLECFALWTGNTRHMRLIFLSARPGWIIYNAAMGSYAGLLIEAFLVASLSLAIFRFDVMGGKIGRKA